jgi:hypothetical protein
MSVLQMRALIRRILAAKEAREAAQRGVEFITTPGRPDLSPIAQIPNLTGTGISPAHPGLQPQLGLRGTGVSPAHPIMQQLLRERQAQQQEAQQEAQQRFDFLRQLGVATSQQMGLSVAFPRPGEGPEFQGPPLFAHERPRVELPGGGTVATPFFNAPPGTFQQIPPNVLEKINLPFQFLGGSAVDAFNAMKERGKLVGELPLVYDRAKSAQIFGVPLLERGGIKETLARQEARSGPVRLISETLTDPFLGSALIRGGIRLGAKTAAKGIIRPGESTLMWRELRRDFLPLGEQAQLTIDQLQTPGLIRNFLEKYSDHELGGWAMRNFSVSAMADPNNSVARATLTRMVLEEKGESFAALMMREASLSGDARAIFGFDHFGIVQNPALRGRIAQRLRPRALLPAQGAQRSVQGESFFEIAQFPERFTLTSQQRGVLDRINAGIERIEAGLLDVGVGIDDVLGKVPGRFFPNFWQYLNKARLEKPGISRKIGVNPYYRDSRIHLDTSDALKRGYSGNPMEALEIYYRSAWKRYADAVITDIVKGHGYTMLERRAFFGAPLLAESAQIIKRTAAATMAHRIVFDFTAGKSPGLTRIPRMRSAPGAAAAREHFPILMDDLERAMRLSTEKTFPQARQHLRTEVTKHREATKKALADVEEEVKKLNDATRYRGGTGGLGEFMAPGTAVSGRIYTPAERVKDIFHSFPEADLTDFKTIPEAQMKDLERVILGTEPGGTLYGLAKGGAQLSSAFRSMVAGLDAGVGMIHLMPLMVTNPVAWERAMRLSVESLWDKAKFARELELYWDDVADLRRFNQLGAQSEMVEALGKEGLLSRVLTVLEPPLPGVITEAGPVQQAARATAGRALATGAKAFNTVGEQFNAALLLGKIYTYSNLKYMAQRIGTEQAFREAAEMSAKMTGTISMANLGLNPTFAQVLSAWFMFAPRYSIAVASFMTDALSGLATGRSGLKGVIARQVLGKMLMSGMIMYAAIATRLGQEMHLDPRKSKFLTIQIGDTNVGIGSKFIQLARFGMGGLADSITKPNEFWNITSGDSRLNRFIRGNLSPPSGLVTDMITGRTYMGEPTKGMNFFKHAIPNSVLPFWASGYLDSPRPGWAGAPAEFGGLRSFPVSLWQRATDKANIEAHKIGNVDFWDMSKSAQKRLLKVHPEIQREFDESNREWAGRGDQVAQVRVALQKQQDERLTPELDRVEARFWNGQPGIRYNGDMFKDGLRTYGIMKRTLRDDLLGNSRRGIEGQFPKVRELFESLGLSPNAHAEDIAWHEWAADVIGGDFESDIGEYNYEARDEAVEAFRKKWGDRTLTLMQERQLSDFSPFIQQFKRARDSDIMRRYWDVGVEILRQMGEDTQVANYKRWRKEPIPEIRNELKKEFELGSIITAVNDARTKVREQNRAIDAFSAMFYGTLIRHPDNLDADGRPLPREQLRNQWEGLR